MAFSFFSYSLINLSGSKHIPNVLCSIVGTLFDRKFDTKGANKKVSFRFTWYGFPFRLQERKNLEIILNFLPPPAVHIILF